MIIIAGLGNPGLKYRKTRHNAGFEVMDVISKKYGIPIKKKERNARFGLGMIGDKKVLLLKPLTYMNNSGESIAAWVRYYNIDPEKELIIISDDVSLDPGFIRVRRKGSAGGHNGLKNIIKMLGTESFARVRVGVGKAEPGDDMITHVLGRMRKEERKKLEAAEADAADAVEVIVTKNIDSAMNEFNKKK